MPFTLSHPAATLPFMRPPFVAAALVAGAAAPDMPYFVRVAGIPVTAQSWYEPFMNATTSHTLTGAIVVAGPYALALYGVARLAHRPVGAALPAVAARTAAEPPGPRPSRPNDPRGASARIRSLAWILLSLLIGIATHVAWDWVVHDDGYVVNKVAWLSGELAGSLTWSRALQHVSTVVGLVAIAVYGWRRRHRLFAGPGERRGRVALVGLVAGIVAVAGAFVGTSRWWEESREHPPGQVIEGVLADAAKGAGLTLAAAFAVYVAAWWVYWFVTPGAAGSSNRRQPRGRTPVAVTRRRRRG